MKKSRVLFLSAFFVIFNSSTELSAKKSSEVMSDNQIKAQTKINNQLIKVQAEAWAKAEAEKIKSEGQRVKVDSQESKAESEKSKTSK